jgi:glycosyltransferase involved in cell wall biosynthesis
VRITIATGPLLPVPALRGGAIPRMWLGLAKEFAARGNDVCIFARRFPGQPDQEVVSGIRFLRHGGYDQSRWIALDLARDFAYAVRVAHRLPPADILVTNDFWLPVIAPRLCPAAGKIVVNANRHPKGQYGLYGRASLIAAASTAVREAIETQTPALKGRIEVFPNPVDLHSMRPDENARSSAPRTLLFVGRLHPEKGVHLLAEAFGRVTQRQPGWRLRIVGPWRAEQGGGGEGYLGRLRKLLEGAPADIVEPQFDPAMLAGEYRAASLFCYPSLAESGESFGLAALEAMACGVAPIVSALDCFRDFVADGKTGWIFDHRAADPADSLAAALGRGMVDPEATAAMGRRASGAAREFGYAPVADRYLSRFAALLES